MQNKITKSEPIWLITDEWIHYVCLITRIKNSSYWLNETTVLSECPNSVFVDYSISDIVISLNESGYETNNSCSGLKIEHMRSRYEMMDAMKECKGYHPGYISFKEGDAPKIRDSRNFYLDNHKNLFGRKSNVLRVKNHEDRDQIKNWESIAEKLSKNTNKKVSLIKWWEEDYTNHKGMAYFKRIKKNPEIQ